MMVVHSRCPKGKLDGVGLPQEDHASLSEPPYDGGIGGRHIIQQQIGARGGWEPLYINE
jgi:hypothetical protein